MDLQDPGYVAMVRARIAIGFGDRADIFRAVCATHLRETPSVETMVLEGDTILFNRNYAANTARSPAGRAQLTAEIIALFN